MTSDHTNPLAAITIVSDRGFVLPVFVLCCSLRYHGVRAPIYILSVGFTPQERHLFEQLPDVEVVKGDPANQRSPATRKGEAILAAARDGASYVTLLDGDCVVTGDISSQLTPSGEKLFVRARDPAEDAWIFAGRNRYAPNEAQERIPQRILDTWRDDIAERSSPRQGGTVLGGNLSVHRSQLPFIERWQREMMRILPNRRTASHDFESFAYFNLDEFVLSALLLFAESAPPLGEMLLDKDSEVYVAHLGPHPKPWKIWSKAKIKYFDEVIAALDWARNRGHELPPLPWTFRRWAKPGATVLAEVYELFQRGKSRIRGASPIERFANLRPASERAVPDGVSSVTEEHSGGVDGAI